METTWNRIDRVLLENQHRQISTREISDLAGTSIENAHSKLNCMFKYAEVTRKKRILYGNVKPNVVIMWQLKPIGVPRVEKRMERFK